MINDEKSKDSIFKLTKWISIISVFIFAVVSVLIIINYLQITFNNPVNNTAITQLYEKLKEIPDDENLKEQIRDLDLMSRKAFLTKQWQINTGAIISVIAFIIFISSLKLNINLRKTIKSHNKSTGISINKSSSFYAVASFGVIIILTVIITSYFTHRMIGGNFLTTCEKSSLSNENPDYTKNWPSFRGPYGLGKSFTDFTPISFNVKTGEGIIWKQELLKKGFNSPVVWNDKIFLSGSDDNDIEIYCYDFYNGSLLWKKSIFEFIEKKEFPKVSPDTGYSASTMTTDGKNIYSIFPTGDILCMDIEGNKVWTKNLGMFDNTYGYASSLVIYENILVVQYDFLQIAKLYGIDGSTGNILWENQRETFSSWASPVIVKDKNKKPVIIVNGNPLVTAHDLKTGKTLWSAECLSGDVAVSPAYSDGRVFSANQYAKLACMDFNSGKILWEYAKELPDVASPVATKDYVFLPTGYGPFICLDANKGNVLWTKEFDEGFYSSVLISGDNVYVIDKKGRMYVFKVSDKYQQIGEYDLGESCLTTPAIADGKMIIRGDKFLYCIGGTK